MQIRTLKEMKEAVDAAQMSVAVICEGVHPTPQEWRALQDILDACSGYVTERLHAAALQAIAKGGIVP